MKNVAILFLAAILLTSCENSNQQPIDPFLIALSQDAQAYEMPEGFVEEFMEQYLAEVTPAISRIKAGTDPTAQDPEIWNLRMLIYTNLWGEHGVDMQYVPYLSGEDIDSIQSEMIELRKEIEERDIQISKLMRRIKLLESEQAKALEP